MTAQPFRPTIQLTQWQCSTLQFLHAVFLPFPDFVGVLAAVFLHMLHFSARAALCWAENTCKIEQNKGRQFQQDHRRNGKDKINTNLLSYREKICTLVLVWSDPDSTRLARVLKPELMIIRRAQSAEVKLDRQLPCKGQLHSDSFAIHSVGIHKINHCFWSAEDTWHGRVGYMGGIRWD